MKVPVPPPSLTEVATRISERRAGAVLTKRVSVMSGDYLAWDKLRYKTPPEGLSVEEWWFAVRTARHTVERQLPFVDVDQHPFSYTLPDVVLEAVDAVTRDASGVIAISEQVTNSAMRDRYVVSSLIEEAITSSQLEGAATSRQVAKEMIRTGRRPVSLSEQMILNNYQAMRRIVELRDTALTPELVCEIHRIVTDQTLDDPTCAGAVQTDDSDRVAVWGDEDQLLHKPPPVAQLPDRLDRLCRFANGNDDGAYVPPVLRAITVHFMMGYDHYFADGNGRTARAVFYWTMLRHGFWLTEFLTISRILRKAPAQYARSFLLTEQDEGDLTHFFVYHLDVVRRAIADLHSYLARKAEELRDVQAGLRAVPGEFSHRQLALLEHAVKNPGAAYTVRSHAESHRVSAETARQDLMGLEQRSYLVRTKLGKQFCWVPVPDLARRLGRR